MLSVNDDGEGTTNVAEPDVDVDVALCEEDTVSDPANEGVNERGKSSKSNTEVPKEGIWI